jgi:hypothetical protein
VQKNGMQKISTQKTSTKKIISKTKGFALKTNNISNINIVCPYCKVEYSKNNLFFTKRGQTTILNTHVKCINSECKTKIKIEDIDNHLNKECLYQIRSYICDECGEDVLLVNNEKHTQDDCTGTYIQCVNCDDIYIRGLWFEHEIVCPNRILKCEYCSYVATFNEINSHTKKCPYKIIECDQCGIPVQNQALVSHKEKDCAQQMIHCDMCYKWVTRMNFNHHTSKECVPNIVKCRMCQNDFAEKYISEHLDNCNNRCAHCRYRKVSISQINNYEVHGDMHCPYVQAKCTNCSKYYSVRVMNSHSKKCKSLFSSCLIS